MRKPAAILLVLSLAVLALALVPTAGLAAKSGGSNKPAGGGGGGGGSSLTLVALDPDDGGANYAEQVTFTVSVSPTVTNRPFVRLDCYQNKVHVYWSSAGFFADYLWPSQQIFTLTSSYWTGGAANCTATLYYSDGNRFRDLGSVSFPVAA